MKMKNWSEVSLDSTGVLTDKNLVEYVYWSAKAENVIAGIHIGDPEAIATAFAMISEASEFLTWQDYDDGWLLDGNGYSDTNISRLVTDVQSRLLAAIRTTYLAQRSKLEKQTEALKEAKNDQN